MTRKPFALATILAALSMFAGLHTPARAQAQLDRTTISTNSWAATPTGSNVVFNLHGHNMAGSLDGFICVTGTGWTSVGCLASESDYSDADGQHVEVQANIMFSHTVNNVRKDHIRAIAVYHSLIKPDGSQWEGITISDRNGKVLYSPGTDSNGQLQLFKLTRGALFIAHDTVTPDSMAE